MWASQCVDNIVTMYILSLYSDSFLINLFERIGNIYLYKNYCKGIFYIQKGLFTIYFWLFVQIFPGLNNFSYTVSSFVFTFVIDGMVVTTLLLCHLNSPSLSKARLPSVLFSPNSSISPTCYHLNLVFQTLFSTCSNW